MAKLERQYKALTVEAENLRALQTRLPVLEEEALSQADRIAKLDDRNRLLSAENSQLVVLKPLVESLEAQNADLRRAQQDLAAKIDHANHTISLLEADNSRLIEERTASANGVELSTSHEQFSAVTDVRGPQRGANDLISVLQVTTLMLQERAAALEAENATLHDTLANSQFKVKHLEEALADAKRLKNQFADDNQCSHKWYIYDCKPVSHPCLA